MVYVETNDVRINAYSTWADRGILASRALFKYTVLLCCLVLGLLLAFPRFL